MGKQHDRRSQSAATVSLAITIAGSDSSAGAGVQADLKTFSALGVYGLTAVTCIVAEIPGKVSRIEPVSARIVREQIEVLVKNFPIGAHFRRSQGNAARRQGVCATGPHRR